MHFEERRAREKLQLTQNNIFYIEHYVLISTHFILFVLELNEYINIEEYDTFNNHLLCLFLYRKTDFFCWIVIPFICKKQNENRKMSSF